MHPPESFRLPPPRRRAAALQGCTATGYCDSGDRLRIFLPSGLSQKVPDAERRWGDFKKKWGKDTEIGRFAEPFMIYFLEHYGGKISYWAMAYRAAAFKWAFALQVPVVPVLWGGMCFFCCSTASVLA